MESKRSSTVKNTISRRKRKTLGTVGILVFVLAVVGLIYLAMGSIRLTGQILDNTKEKQKLEHFILPVIMFDPMTFDSPQTADPLMILQSSIWSTLLSKNREDFVRDDFGSVLLPQTDVEVQAAKLYGPEVKLQHQSIVDYESMINYDPETKVYSIPALSQMAVYTPKIMKITGKSDLYTLEVGYIPPGNLWQTDADGNTYEPVPDKIMLLEMKKVKGGYNVVALKDGPNPQVVDPNAAQLITSAAPSGTEDDLLDSELTDSVQDSDATADSDGVTDSDDTQDSAESSSDAA